MTACKQYATNSYHFSNFTGRWDELIWLSEQAEARALAADDKENAGWQAYRAGLTYSLRNQPAEVLACAARAAEHWQDSTPRNKAIAIQLRGLGHKLNKDYPAAIAAYREALEIYRSISPESDDVAIALELLWQTQNTQTKTTPPPSATTAKPCALRRIIKDDEGIAIYTGNLAALALDREQWAEAESLAREALALAEKVGRQELIASDCHRLAKALLKQNHESLKKPYPCPAAPSRFTRACVIPDLQSAQETLAEIERAMQNVGMMNAE